MGGIWGCSPLDRCNCLQSLVCPALHEKRGRMTGDTNASLIAFVCYTAAVLGLAIISIVHSKNGPSSANTFWEAADLE